ncbi:MAG: 2,3-bisphosphoglycerate-independent phosphoglycerate mutase, partial [Slackia sp.]|nr:2,3-bisphosphoglycerate-independent phosphoglycerate mutase [Slackia sp.]
KAVQDGSFFENEALVHAMNNAKENGTALHLIGLLSNGGVHSHNQHLYGLLEMAKKMGVENVYVHALLDGRDVPPSSGKDFVKELMEKMKEIGVGKVATVMGRYYAMDRDNRWERVEKAYNAMVCREGEEFACPVCAVSKSYENEVTDEFVVPCVIKDGAPVASGDSVVFFNFRPDRAREITRTFVDPDFTGFTRKNGFFPLTYVCMTQYDATMPNVEIAFKPQSLKNTLGEYVSDKGLKQLRIAETEKYAHVTFFLNGGIEAEKEGEQRTIIASPKVATYDLQPEMSEPAVADTLAAAIENDEADVYIVNFANPDMVGHTGVIPAAVAAIEAVDAGVAKVVEAVKAKGGFALVTADHGNADKMIADDGTPHTAHTTALVPFALADGTGAGLKLNGEQGALCDIAPTLLAALGMESPKEFTGRSLLA